MTVFEDTTTGWRHRVFVAYVLLMVLVFLLPVPQTPVDGFHFIDKLVHFGIFLGFAVLLYVDRGWTPTSTLLASVAFAAVIELLQGLVSYRDADWYDLAAGAAGGLLGAALAGWWARKDAAATRP